MEHAAARGTGTEGQTSGSGGVGSERESPRRGSQPAGIDDVDTDGGTSGADEELASRDRRGGQGEKERGFWGYVALPLVAVYRFCFPKKPRPFIVELPFLLVIALFLAFLIKSFLIQAFVIPSGSMQNTLAIGDRVVVNRLGNWLGSKPSRGDVVVFQDPGGWLGETPQQSKNVVTKALAFIGVLPEDNGDLIKRVIAVGGDTVACCTSQGLVTVNGVPLHETSYLYPGNAPSLSPFRQTIPQGYLWVMGDHRAISEDSRAHADLDHGLVPESKVVGRAVAVVWPLSQIRTLSVPSTFHQNFSHGALNAAAAVPPAAYGAAAVVPLGVVRLRRRRKLPRATA